ANIPSKVVNFKMQILKEKFKVYLCILKYTPRETRNLRIHSECITCGSLVRLKCDVGQHLEFSLKYIENKGGIVIYVRQEVMGICRYNKVNDYALQDKVFDTIKANHKLGFKADEGTYEIVEFIFTHYEIFLSYTSSSPRATSGYRMTSSARKKNTYIELVLL
ncbi:hypothetical protein ACISN5_09015, partial [Campylobacter jejuni]